MAVDTARPTSRRGLLASLGAAIAGAVAISLGRAMPVQAEGEAMVVGGDYDDATTLTFLGNKANNSDVFRATSFGSGIAVTGVSVSHVGVYGAGNMGVFGDSTAVAGRGVHGEGFVGVEGLSNGGIGVRAWTLKGVALETTGRIQALQISGVATIPTGATTLVITPGVAVTSQSFVLLTPKTKLGGRDLWFTTDPAAGTFTIRISSARTAVTRIAWLLLG